MTTDVEKKKDYETSALAAYGGQQGLTDSTGQTAVNGCYRRTFTVLISDAATAGTAVTETNLTTVERACRVVACRVAAPIGVTASDTTFATFTVAKRTAGGGATTVATQTTKTTGSGGLGTLTAFKPYALTVTNSAVQLAAGDSLTVAVAKASTGVALTAATSYVDVTVDVEEI